VLPAVSLISSQERIKGIIFSETARKPTNGKEEEEREEGQKDQAKR
jgi:hypothetical protein